MLPRDRHIALLALLLLSLAMGALGCPKKVPPPDNAFEEPAKLRGAIQGRTQRFEDARFKEVVLDYFGKKERVKVRQLILVSQPDMVRVQTRLPGSNEILSLLVTDGNTFALHRRKDNKYMTGPPTPANINRLLPVDLSAPDVVRVMFGGAPWDRFDREPGDPHLEWDNETGRYFYWVRTEEDGRLTMQVRHTDYAVVEVTEYGPGGELVYKYTTEDWETVGDHLLPTYRRFVWPGRDLDFSLDVGETEVDIGLSEQLFQFPPPPGSEIIRVDGGPPVQPGPQPD